MGCRPFLSCRSCHDHHHSNHIIFADIFNTKGPSPRVIDRNYTGFLSVQLIISEDKCFFVEFDIRPGEPEFINVINSIDDNVRLSDAIVFNDGVNFLPCRKFNSVSLAIGSMNYPMENELKVKHNFFNFSDSSKYKLYYSKVEKLDNYIYNYDNGRFCFAYFESLEGEKALSKDILEFELGNSSKLNQLRMKIFK